MIITLNLENEHYTRKYKSENDKLDYIAVSINTLISIHCFRINRMIMLASAVVFMSVIFAAIPWCENFILMMAVSTLNSVFIGGLDVSEY